MLQHLPTNLTLADIATRLFVSRNTVKSPRGGHLPQARRHLPQRCRGPRRARPGLLDETAVGRPRLSRPAAISPELADAATAGRAACSWGLKREPKGVDRCWLLTSGSGQVLWSIFWFFLFFIWIMILFRVFADIFVSQDLSGFAKVMWCIFVIFLPYLGVFVYLIARGDDMTKHAVEAAQAQDGRPARVHPVGRGTAAARTSWPSWRPSRPTARSARPSSTPPRRSCSVSAERRWRCSHPSTAPSPCGCSARWRDREAPARPPRPAARGPGRAGARAPDRPQQPRRDRAVPRLRAAHRHAPRCASVVAELEASVDENVVVWSPCVSHPLPHRAGGRARSTATTPSPT